MLLTLSRRQSANGATIGDMRAEGRWLCHTLEDEIREIANQPVEEWKIYGRTAIPAGNYKVVINWSPRFKRELPMLLYVPGFTGVRIHPGNKPEDTEGCVLVGFGVTPDGRGITESRSAFAKLISELNSAYDEGEETWLSIVNPTN
jgi:hypothetical protein